MRLTIPQDRVTSDFIEYLIDEIKDFINYHMDKDRLDLLNIFLDVAFPSLKDEDIYDILEDILENLLPYNYNNYTQIEVSINTVYKNTNVKLESLMRYIDYGILSVRGCGIFSKAFDYFKSNLNVIYYYYFH